MRKYVEDLRFSLLDILKPELPMEVDRYKLLQNVQFDLGETLKEPKSGCKSRHLEDTALRGSNRTCDEHFHATESSIASSPLPAFFASWY